MLPPEGRLPGLDRFMQRQLYFVLHAARQTGKTTAMRAFAARLRDQGVVALHATLETSQGAEAVEEAEPRWLSAIRSAAWDLGPGENPPEPATVESEAPGHRLAAWLQRWSEALAPRPLVLLLDEVDVLAGPALVSLLRQLRSGFHQRPDGFPASIALVGMRDLRDYLTRAKDGAPLNPGSPFNIKAASLTLRNFTQDEVTALYAQHTADTGQVFLPEAVAYAHTLTDGQPYLVNALAGRVVDDLVPDRSIPVSVAAIDEAREMLILDRTTHLDNLGWRLREPRVAPIVRAILLGDDPHTVRTASDDFTYCVDLGLVTHGPQGPAIANPMYREVLARELSRERQDVIPQPWWPWQTREGRLDFPALVDAFLAWWRENADVLYETEQAGYREAAAHIAFMGFLQRVVNGGGRVHREYAAARGRLDLLVEYGPDRFAVELKRVPPTRRTLEQVREEGVAQLRGYLDTLGLPEGWFVLFDQRPGLTWEQRLWTEDRVVDGKRIRIRGA